MATIRCSSCYSYGHNKRGCLVLKELAATAAAKPVEDRTIWESRAMAGLARWSTTVRCCTYCGEQKHNITGCNVRKTDIATATDILVTWRKSFVEQAKNHGFGIGAVIKHNHYSMLDNGYTTEPKGNNSPTDNFHYRLVTEINLGSLNHWNKHGEDVFKGNSFFNIGSYSTRALAGGHYDCCYLPDEIRRSMGMTDAYYRTLIESPVSSIGIDEANFVSKFRCQEEIYIRFHQKQKSPAKQYPSRSDLIYDSVFPRA